MPIRYDQFKLQVKEVRETSANEASDHNVAGRDSGVKKNMDQTTGSGNKLEARKQQRALRAVIWKELMEIKPDEKYEDPKDLAAIRYAQSHMGDYKLKSADHYIVPESERIDADRKKKQIMLLKESINAIQENFNRQVLSLRSRKASLVSNFSKNIQTIQKISHELSVIGDNVTPFDWDPKMEETAFPENRFDVSQADILKLQKMDAESQSRSSGDDGMGFEGGSAAAPEKEVKKEAVKPVSAPQSEGIVESHDIEKSVNNSQMDLFETNNRKTLLLYEKSKLITVSVLVTLENGSSDERV
jgi:hypothetical protein